MRLPRGMSNWVMGQSSSPWTMPKQAFRGILSDAQIIRLARSIWPKFRTADTIPYGVFCDDIAEWGRIHGLELDPDSIIGHWVAEQFLHVSPDATEFRFKPRAADALELWLEADRLWNSGENKPMPWLNGLLPGRHSVTFEKSMN